MFYEACDICNPVTTIYIYQILLIKTPVRAQGVKVENTASVSQAYRKGRCVGITV